MTTKIINYNALTKLFDGEPVRATVVTDKSIYRDLPIQVATNMGTLHISVDIPKVEETITIWAVFLTIGGTLWCATIDGSIRQTIKAGVTATISSIVTLS